MKKIGKKRMCVAGVCLTCAVAATFGLAACGESTDARNGKLSVDEFYGIGAVSTARLLGSSVSAKAMGRLAGAATALANDGGAEESGAVEQYVDDFNKYFAALDGFIGGEPVKVDTSANTDAQYADYVTKLTITGVDSVGSTTLYKMYYNEELVKSEDDGEERESAYVLDGVLVIGETDYMLSGERSVEVEKDEREDEMKIRAYTDDTSDTYIEMKQEVSEEMGEREIEYVYRVYSGGRLVEETAVEFETESSGAKTETDLEIEFRKGDAKGKYSVEKEVKYGKTEITVKYDIDGKTGKFKAKEIIDENGERAYKYMMSDNFTLVFPAR